MSAAISMGLPTWISIASDESCESMPYGSTATYFSGTTVECIDTGGDEGMKIYLSSPSDSIQYIKLRWNIRLPNDGRFLADEWERGYGTMGFQSMHPNRIMPWYFICASHERVAAYGVKVRPNAMCFWQVDPAGVTLFLDVRNGGSGVKLGERKLHVATVLAAQYEGDDSFSCARRFCALMCSDPVLPDGPIYGSNNWYYAYGRSSSEEILQDADYVLKLVGNIEAKPCMVVDDCWEEHLRLNGSSAYNGGPWKKGNDRFPDMPGLAAALDDKGVVPGIWIRLLLNEDEAIPESWRSELNGCLDPTQPDALEYIGHDVLRMCQWGYRIVKHDFSTFDLFGRWGFEMNPLVTREGWHFHNEGLTNAEVVKLLYRAIYRVAHEHGAMVLGCNTIGHLGAGLMEINRVGDDISGLQWERTRQIGVNSLAFRLPQHGTFFAVDADCVGVTKHVDWKFNRQWADVLARSGTPLFVSVQPGVLTERQERELGQSLKVAACGEEHATPKDWELLDCPEVWESSGTEKHYEWYEPAGLEFSALPTRYVSFLSSIS